MTTRPLITTTNQDMSPQQAEEAARVGILPCKLKQPIGTAFTMAGQRFVVTGYATCEEFLAAALAEGLPVQDLSAETIEFRNFLRISTD